MITKPTLKPMRGFVEVEVNGRRMYKNVKTGALVSTAAEAAPEKENDSESVTWDALAAAYKEGVNSLE